MNDGTVYEGDWNMGEMQGMGQLKLSDGSVYIGEFSRGIFNGKVRFVSYSVGVIEIRGELS